MQGKSLFLIVGAAVAAVVAYLVAQSRAPTTELATQVALVPALSERLNDVTQVSIAGPGNVPLVTLVRGEDRWGIAERGGYAADTSKVRRLLIDLGDARLVEQKTSREENYSALGVGAIDSDTAGGIQVSIDGIGDAAPVIIGKPSRGTGAVYVRRADEAASWAADKRLRVDRDPSDWLIKDLVDINAARVKSVRIEHADGEVLEATRGEVNFSVANLPDDASLSSPTAANALADVFDDLRFEDVVPASEFDTGDAPSTTATYLTSDGLKLTAVATAANGKYYVSAATEPVPVDPAQFVEPTAEDAATEEGDAPADSAPEPTPEQKAAAMLEAMTAQSADINARVSGWVFTIPLYKYEQLTRRVADFVASEDDGEMGPN